MFMTQLPQFSLSICSKSEKEFFLLINVDYTLLWNFKKVSDKWRQSIVSTSCNFINIDTVKKYTGNDSYLYSDQWWSLFHFNREELGDLGYEEKHAMEQALVKITSTDKVITTHLKSWNTPIESKEKIDEEVHLFNDKKRNAQF
jgi:hypothetical protein